MFNIFAEVSSTDAGLKAIEEAVKELKRYETLIGIPEDASARQKIDKVTNAELLFIHTNGSPINNIPPRPVLEPAIINNSKGVSDMLKKAIDTAVSGNKDGIVPALQEAGQYGENVAKMWFTNEANGWAENSPATLLLKQKKGGSPRPLIDTAELRKSITHVVREVQ